MDVQNIRNGEKFDKYYHKNIVSNILLYTCQSFGCIDLVPEPSATY